MPTNEEGEFELVLGNKQLLSVFFLVVLLLGVFFSMGYIVGRSTAPAGSQSAVNKGPLVVEPAGSPPVVAKNELPDPTKPSPSTFSGEPRPEPKPAEPTPEPAKPEPVRPEPPKPEPKAKQEPKPKPEPVKPEPPKPQPVKSEPKSSGGKGTYLQVAATRTQEADLLMESLKKKGFGVATMPVPDSSLIRVLVGPYNDADGLSEAKRKLKDLGISAPIPRKL